MPNSSTDQLFNDDNSTAPAVDPAKNYLEELVGEGKKFKTEADLARGKMEADLFIQRLQKENEGMRTELAARTTLENLIDKIGTNKNTFVEPKANPTLGGDEKENSEAKFTPETVDKLLADKLSEYDKRREQERNLQVVTKSLVETFGPNYSSHLESVASELNLSKPFLTELAKTQPSAFMKLVGVSTKRVSNEVSSHHIQPSVAGNAGTASGGVKDFSYYEKIRTSNPNLYWSREVQNEMHKEATRQGESFLTKG